jgi:hypothetical protein
MKVTPYEEFEVKFCLFLGEHHFQIIRALSGV